MLTVICMVTAQALFAQKLTYAPNLVEFGDDTIYMATGSTYAYTVDTPPGEGRVATTVTPQAFIAQLNEAYNPILRFSLQDDTTVILRGHAMEPRSYFLKQRAAALSANLQVSSPFRPEHVPGDIMIEFTAGQRSPNVNMQLVIPAAIKFDSKQVMVNVIGRGEVPLAALATTSSGRFGAGYPYPFIGKGNIALQEDSSHLITLENLDLRAKNGADVVFRLPGAVINRYTLEKIYAQYITSEPEVLTSGIIDCMVPVSYSNEGLYLITRRMERYVETKDTYTHVSLKWYKPGKVKVMQSLDEGKTWQPAHARMGDLQAEVNQLMPDRYYRFMLQFGDGSHSPYLEYYSGKQVFLPKDTADCTDELNAMIAACSKAGGGTILFKPGTYNVRTVHLKNDVYLYIGKGATIKALKGGDAPESTWFSDKAYRSGTSPTDHGPYDDPENYLTKQDVGHHYFQNAMFTGERLDNIKIIGNGRITGNGNLVTSDKVMNNAPDNRSDKMISLKLCTNVEIGGVYRKDDLWYDKQKDEPYYISGDPGTDNMLHIDQAGHFVLLATGTDSIFVHDTYFGKHSPKNARDIYDFMACNNVTVTNIYSRVSSDDIVKPGSDCSLGFTRPAKHYRVRNIIGDTNCNLFQVGSETADDIRDICVDNIYVLGANKAGFSISTNDGAHISDIHLNCGHTGPLHHRSKMLRAAAPFFISISNRARILGAQAATFSYSEHGRDHKELLVTNVSIGKVENILLNGIDITEVYGGSSYSGNRWKPFDGTQRRFAAIVAGYALPQNIGFTLPDGRATGYISNIHFTDIYLTAKGGNPITDTAQVPQELGVGQYNAADLKIQPAYGLWARHVQQLVIKNAAFAFEQADHRYGIFLEDVVGATLQGLRIQKTREQQQAVRVVNSSGTRLSNITTF